MTQIFAERKSECGELAAACMMVFVWARTRAEMPAHLHLRSSAKSAVFFPKGGAP